MVSMLRYIDDELKHYTGYLTGKSIYCPYQDHFNSDFVRYFVARFTQLRLKNIIVTNDDAEPYIGIIRDPCGHESVYDYELLECDLSAIFMDGRNIFEALKSGSVFDDECIDIIRQDNIVVTMIDDDKFIDVVSLLVDCGKKFIVLGMLKNYMDRTTLKLISDDELSFGYTRPRFMKFGVNTKYYGTLAWFTNMRDKTYSDRFQPTMKYNPVVHLKYDNLDAINVKCLREFPKDYTGMAGVPYDVLRYYDNDRFRIIRKLGKESATINGKFIPGRVLIKIL
jgi:hypothetical protein